MPRGRYFWLLACAWTAAVAGSLAWNLAQEADEVRSLTVEAARALLKKDLLYREWSLLHGGVYVPKTGPTEAGATAQAEERRDCHALGQTLMMLNPAVVSHSFLNCRRSRPASAVISRV